MKFRQRFRLSKSTVLSLLLELGIIHDRFDYSNNYYAVADSCLASRYIMAKPTAARAYSDYSKQKQSSRRLVIGRGVCSTAHALAPTPRPAACTNNVKAILHS